MKCFSCGNTLENGATTLTRTLGGVTYRADVQALVCIDADCNGALVSDEKVAEWEALLVEQAAASPPTSDAFRFMLSWSELSNEDLAVAFGVSTDMVVKYARGQATVPHAIYWQLGKIVAGRAQT